MALDTQALIKHYQAGTFPVLRRLMDGGDVIGDAVDPDNRLLYVIRRGTVITVEYAQNQPVIFSRRKTASLPATVTGR
jgi:hypothetical protein